MRTVDDRARARGAARRTFEILDILGSGGMGIVYKARDRSLEKRRAQGAAARVREHQGGGWRFLSEIKLARKVSDRHVCRIFEYGEDAGLRYICMELVNGVNLKQLVLDEERFLPRTPTRPPSRSPTGSRPSTRRE